MNPGSRHPPQKSPMHKDEIFCKRCVYSGSASLQHNSIIHCLAILVDGGASKAPILFLNWAQKQNVATVGTPHPVWVLAIIYDRKNQYHAEGALAVQ